VVSAGASAAEDYGPFAWSEERSEEFEDRAAVGTSHVLYALSPGGAIATAERVDGFRGEIERAANAHGIDPDRLEAVVYLESAGRPDVIAGETPEAASGLGQILPQTATDLLGMQVDLARSIELTEEIAKAERRGKAAQAERLRRERARIDQRFDPEAALDGAARYLEIADERFGREDLATVSYHMGIGNLESVMEGYDGDAGSYSQLYFDTAPDRSPDAYELLVEFADDSSQYLWRVLAAQRIMRQWRQDPEELERTADLATEKATLEEVYHPEEATKVYETPGDLAAAVSEEELLPLPAGGGPGWKVDPQMGELAAELGRKPSLYRALRPEALATLAFMGAVVERLSGAERPLRVTSTIRDRSYQELLIVGNPEATREYSLHTTGWSFDILREYQNDAQAEAFQFVLDRLRALAVIDYALEPKAIHVTVSPFGAELLEN
jgi:hypothetical protein